MFNCGYDKEKEAGFQFLLLSVWAPVASLAHNGIKVNYSSQGESAQ